MVKLVLIRHGESSANANNTYTGWNDVDLTDLGIKQAHTCAAKLSQVSFQPTAIHTSVLIRAIKTALIISADCHWLDRPLYKNWRLNERHYGALRGLNKDQTRRDYGAAQVAKWRRNYTTVPPLLKHVTYDRRYAQLDPKSVPRGESLKMASDRVLPYYFDQVVPALRDQQDQLIVAHGSTVRVLIKYLDNITGEQLDGIEVANGEPIIYEFDRSFHICAKTTL